MPGAKRPKSDPLDNDLPEATLGRLARDGPDLLRLTNAEPSRSPSVRPGLDPRTAALVRLGALVALGAGAAYYQATVTTAIGEGVSVDEVLAALVAIAPTVGLARLVAATPRGRSRAGL